MAAMESIDGARSVLEEKLIELMSLVTIFDELAGLNAPEWLCVISPRVRDVNAASEVLFEEIHRHARPVLNDMAKLAKG